MGQAFSAWMDESPRKDRNSRPTATHSAEELAIDFFFVRRSRRWLEIRTELACQSLLPERRTGLECRCSGWPQVLLVFHAQLS